jgi:hypothetical protein
MDPSIETRRKEAEDFSSRIAQDRHNAWDSVAELISSEYSSHDPRVLAAWSRRDRLARIWGNDLNLNCQKAGKTAESLAEALGGKSAETLYARETAALCRLLAGEEERAGKELADVAFEASRSLGPVHPQTLSARRSRAWAAAAEGEPGNAAAELAKISEAQAMAFGPGHPERLATEEAMAEALLAAGDDKGARDTYMRLLEALEIGLKRTSYHALSDRARSADINMLADGFGTVRSLLRRQAEELAREKGEGHPETLDALERLADLLDAGYELYQQRYVRERLAKGREHTLGAAHPDTDRAWRDLLNLSRDREARIMMIHAHRFEALSRELGPDSLEALSALSQLARAMSQAGDLEGARGACARLAEARERTLGPDNPETLEALSRLARAMSEAGDLEGARDTFARVAEARERIGPDNLESIMALEDLTDALTSLGDVDAAIASQERVLEA